MRVHRYWKGPLPESEPWRGNVVRGLHEDVTDWDDDKLPGVCLDWVDSRMDLVNETDQLRHRGNCVRWWLLREFGGVWLDHDVTPLVDLTLLPQPFIGGLVAYGTKHPVTCVVGLPRDHELARRMVWLIDSATPSERRSTDVSGDAVVAALFTRCHVRIEPMPFDANGTLWSAERPTYVHEFATSHKGAA